MEDASWLTTAELQKYGVKPESMRDNYFLPRESDVGAYRLSQQCEGCTHVVVKRVNLNDLSGQKTVYSRGLNLSKMICNTLL